MIRIKSWWDSFENAGSRKLVTIRHFNAPSGNDSKGYRKLMRLGAEGVIAFGVFQALCQCVAGLSVEARKKGETVNSDGSLLDLEDLADLTRLPIDLLSSAINLLSSAIEWIEVLEPLENQQSPTHLPSSPTNLPLISQGTPNGEERRGEERRVEEGIFCPPKAADDSETAFDFSNHPKTPKTPKTEQALAIYAAYPRKVGRKPALKAIERALKTKPFNELLDLTEAYSRARKGQSEQFTPHPATWFGQERFLDDPKTWPDAIGGGNHGRTNGAGATGETNRNRSYGIRVDQGASRANGGDEKGPF